MSCQTEAAGLSADTRACLIVDDSRVVRQVARRILEGLNFAVEEAVDGYLALDACRRSMPVAILLDWNMPVMDGIDFLRSLREMERGEEPIVVFCTTMAEIRRHGPRRRPAGGAAGEVRQPRSVVTCVT